MRSDIGSEDQQDQLGVPVIGRPVITHVLDCIADLTKVRVIAEITGPVEELFPYLNAVMANAYYNPAGRTLSFQTEGRLVTVYPHVVTIAKALDEMDAQCILDWLANLMNETYSRRGQIVPSYERRAMPGPLDVYVALPRTNCKQCGEATCIAFACALLQGERRVGECVPLAAYPQAMEALTMLLGPSTKL